VFKKATEENANSYKTERSREAMAKENPRPVLTLGKNRAEALTDGIFAFAMTLLVLGMDVPQPTGGIPDADAVSLILQDIYPDFTHYLVAFIMLASFWLLHHRCYDRLKTIDLRMLWMNIATLVFVALIPFSTDLADDYVEAPLAGLIFSCNMLIVGTLLFLQWRYASRKKDLLSENVTAAQIAMVDRKMIIMPALSILAIAIALMGFPWTVMVYLLAPVTYFFF
jgi:uncharacterized membrane protein